MNPCLTKTYTAGAAIAAGRFVKAGAADYAAIQATDASAALLGVSAQNIAVASGSSVDVVKTGLAYLELGGAVTRGDVLIPDADGKGVTCTVVAGTAQYVGAVAEISGAAGDIIPVLVTAGAVIATGTGIVSADITVTTGQVLALNGTPKVLVAAPGLGKAIIVEDLQLLLVYNSIAYDGVAAGEDLQVRYTDGSGALLATIETTGFIDQAANAYRHSRPVTAAAEIPVANAALVLFLASGEIATGNSPLKVRIRYRTVDVAW